MSSSPLGSSSNLVITLGIFLKLLGFFVVLYSYSETVPAKIQQAEQSLSDQFRVPVTLPRIHLPHQPVAQEIGRSYDAIEKKLKTQIDLFSTEKTAQSRELVLTLPADQVLAMNGEAAKSPDFAAILSQTLQRNLPRKFVYKLDIVGVGANADMLMRGVGDFAQRMVAAQYPLRLITVGYDPDHEQGDKGQGEAVHFRVLAVPE